MEPLRQGATLQQIQDYVAEMEAERHLDRQDLPSQCLKLGEEVGDEAVDTLILLTSIVNRCGIDLEDAFRTKEARNETRVWI